MLIVKRKSRFFSTGLMKFGDIPLNQLRYVNDRKGASTGYKEIQKYAPEGVYHLFRCGGSHNKPFCDGKHMRNQGELDD